jgi:hypothetical protein
MRPIPGLFACSIVLALALPLSQVMASTAGKGEVGLEGGVEGDASHGRYLVEHVAMCVECHSPRDQQGQVLESQALLGAPIPLGGPPWQGPWAIRAPRIRGLPGYDDRQALRLLMEGGIGRDGRRLDPPMPPFRMMRQDAVDVIAYLRSME